MAQNNSCAEFIEALDKEIDAAQNLKILTISHEFDNVACDVFFNAVDYYKEHKGFHVDFQYTRHLAYLTLRWPFEKCIKKPVIIEQVVKKIHKKKTKQKDQAIVTSYSPQSSRGGV